MPVQPCGTVEQEIERELELELLVAASPDAERSPSVAAMAMARMFGYFWANSRAIACCASGLRGAVAPLPVFAWELGLAFFLILKGFPTAGPGQPQTPRIAGAAAVTA